MFLLRDRFDQFDVRVQGEEILLQTWRTAKIAFCSAPSWQLSKWPCARLSRHRRVQTPGVSPTSVAQPAHPERLPRWAPEQKAIFRRAPGSEQNFLALDPYIELANRSRSQEHAIERKRSQIIVMAKQVGNTGPASEHFAKGISSDAALALDRRKKNQKSRRTPDTQCRRQGGPRPSATPTSDGSPRRWSARAVSSPLPPQAASSAARLRVEDSVQHDIIGRPCTRNGIAPSARGSRRISTSSPGTHRTQKLRRIHRATRV